ncbi:MAG: SPFH domain-containing protein [Thermoproteus sp.]|nr:SPFH domain-containing protein [Thermoproteus sp.]
MPQVIQWVNPKEDEIIWRYPVDRIEWGAQLVVEEWQAAVFFRDGKAYDVFRAGRHTITTMNLPLLTAALSRVAGFEKSPFVAAVIYVSLKQYKLPFGGRGQTAELAPIQFYGSAWFRVADPTLFVTQVVGGQGVYTTEDLQQFLRGYFNESLMAELSKQSIFTIYQSLEQASFVLKNALDPYFKRLGLEIIDLRFEGLDVTDPIWRDRLFYIRAAGVNAADYLRMEAVEKAAAELGKSPGAAVGAGLAIIPPLFSPQQGGAAAGGGAGVGGGGGGGQPPGPSGQPPSTVVSGQLAQQQQGAVCPRCGFVNPPGAKFCMNCGAQLPQEKICPKCGFKNPPTAKFCMNCGSPLP